MKIGHGRLRLLLYSLWGVGMGTAILIVHEFVQDYAYDLQHWVLAVLIPVFLFGMAMLARRENSLYEWGSRLDAARKRSNELMHEAAKKSWVPEFTGDWLPTCWKELDCDKTDCPVFGLEHTRCWLIAGTYCRGEVQGKFAKKFKDCAICPVYQQATGDPVREMTENFYAMNYMLSEREEQLEAAYKEASDRSEKLSGLVALSEAALSSIHLGDLLQNLLQSAASFIGADMGCVSLVDPSGESLVARVSYGVPPGGAGKLAERVGEGILGRAFAGTYIAVSEDLSIDSRFVNPYLKTLEVKTLISLPLVSREKPLGMLTLGTFTPHHYTEEEKDSLCVAADRIAAAVENSQLANELSRDRGRVEMMTALTQELASQEGMTGVYESFVKHAAKLIKFDRASLEIWHPDTDEVEVVAVSTKASRSWLDKGLRLPRQAVPVSEVISTGRPLVRDEIRGDEYASDKLLVEEGIRSSVVIPLFSKGEVSGSVDLGSFHTSAFADADLELLEPLVRQLGLVLDNARLLEETRRLSLTDNLTELYNHRYFYEAVVREVSRAERHGDPVSLLLMDVDDFKSFNDLYGHPQGDQVLRVIAQTVRTCLRDIDVAARYGGDEYAVLMPEVGIDEDGGSEAVRLGERIQKMLAENSFLKEKGGVSVSIGVAEFPAQAVDARQLFERSGWAMRESKSGGKNRVTLAKKMYFHKSGADY